MGANLEPQQKRFKKIYFEIGNICNLKCSFCPEVDRRSFQIEEENFRNTLMSLIPLTERVCLHLMGEPTNHPKFHELIKVAFELKAKLEITTNGTLLNETISNALLNPAVHQVNFSLQSFFDNYPKADATKYLKKIFNFTKRALNERPDLYLNYRLWNLNSQDQDLNQWILLQIESEFQVTINRNVDVSFRKSKNVKQRLYLHFDQRFDWPNLNSDVISDKGTCYGTRDHMGIHANGDVVPCCLDKEAVLKLGNIYESSLDKILSGQRFQTMHKGFLENKLTEDLCRRCDFIKRF